MRRDPALGGGAVLDLGCYCVSATRLLAGEPVRIHAEQVRDGEDGVDVRLTATLRMPSDVLAHLDIALDLIRRDELELIGTEGKIVVQDPWLCRSASVEVWQGGQREDVPVDLAVAGLPEGDEGAVYRLEMDRVSATINGEHDLSFGRDDAVAQARAVEALLETARRGQPVDLQ